MYVGLGNLGEVKINLCRNLGTTECDCHSFLCDLCRLNYSIKTRGQSEPPQPIQGLVMLLEI